MLLYSDFKNAKHMPQMIDAGPTPETPPIGRTGSDDLSRKVSAVKPIILKSEGPKGRTSNY